MNLLDTNDLCLTLEKLEELLGEKLKVISKENEEDLVFIEDSAGYYNVSGMTICVEDTNESNYKYITIYNDRYSEELLEGPMLGKFFIEICY